MATGRAPSLHAGQRFRTEERAVQAWTWLLVPNLTAEGQWTLQDFELDEGSLQVKMLADDVASVAYKVTERLLVEGQELSLEANDASVWVRENGQWKCAIHTETLSGDPFGRDRKT
jgi:hypothetical protein